MKNTIKWISGVIFILVGIRFLFQGNILAGFFMLVSGAFCVPPILSLVENSTKYQFKSWQKYLIVIGCFILGGTFMPKNDANNSATNSQATTSQKEEVSKTTKRVGKKGNVYFNINGDRVEPNVIYEIVEEEIYDVPIKTQITQHIALEGQFDKEVVKEVLEIAYQDAKKRTGFKHYNPATHYHIVVYSDIKRAKSKSGNWVGLMNKIKDNDEDYEINEDLIIQSQEPLTDKFGLSETTRMEVFKEIVLAERKATEEAEKKYDLSKMQGTPKEKLSVLGEYRSKLEEQYKNSLAKKYKLTREQLSEIGTEGIIKGWPFPESN